MQIDNYDALGLSELILKKQISPEELLEHCIQKAEQWQPQLNFLSHKLYDYGRKQIQLGLSDGSFSGVPFLLKNLGGACLDTPLTDGSRLYSETICTHTDEVVKRFQKAGLVIFGRSNAAELGFSFTTETEAHGVTHNPWNLALSSGGSSGGAAAAVAARITPIAHASDGGGSIRLPASCCGIFGLKPSRARVPMGPLKGESWGGFGTHHVLSVSVRDSAAMLDCIAGPELGDPYFAPTQSESYLKCLNKPLNHLKIGVLTQLNPIKNLIKPVQQSFDHSLQLLENLGHDLETIHFAADIDLMRKSFLIIISAHLAATIKEWEKEHPKLNWRDKLEPINQTFVDFAAQLTAADFAEATKILQQQCRKVAEQFANYDVIVTPTTAELAPMLGELAGNHKDFALFNAKQLKFSPYTGLANMTGQPAMSVPLYWTDENIPLGTHFLAPFGEEGLLFQLAKQLEDAQPWQNKIPNLQ